MKTKRTIGFVLIMTIFTSVAYWLGYEHGTASTRGKLNVVSSARQVGLSFRGGRNDIRHLSITGTVSTPSEQR